MTTRNPDAQSVAEQAALHAVWAAQPPVAAWLAARNAHLKSLRGAGMDSATWNEMAAFDVAYFAEHGHIPCNSGIRIDG